MDAGFTDVAVVQIGGETQPNFLDCAGQLLPALREEYGKAGDARGSPCAEPRGGHNSGMTDSARTAPRR